MRNLRIGLAIEHRRAFRQARPIHQDHAAVAILRIDGLIGAQRGIASQEAPVRAAIAMQIEKGANGKHALDARHLPGRCRDDGSPSFALMRELEIDTFLG
jgi:hypothetical protein